MAKSTVPFLNPAYLRSVRGLELAARQAVTNLLAGGHWSKRTGAGLEFSNYRSYQAGDDLRMLDWKLYARSDRFFIREAEQEKRLNLHFVLDASASMLHEDQDMQKIDYARFLIATFAWLALQQGDAMSLHSINAKQLLHLGPKPGRRFFQRLLHQLVQIDCKGTFPKEASIQTFHFDRSEKALLIFITDLYEHEAELQRIIQELQRTKSELLLFHLMGENELELSYKKKVSLEDLETGERVQLGNAKMQAAYKAQLAARLEHFKKIYTAQHAHYALINMAQSPGETLRYYLKTRQKLLK